MSKIPKIIALFLLVIWFPATMHCELESVGVDLLTHGQNHQNAPDADAAKLHSLNDTEFGNVTASPLKVFSPALALIAIFSFVFLLPKLRERFPVYIPEDPPDVRALRQTWQFEYRAALPVRAPACVA